MKFAFVGTIAFGILRFIVPVTGAINKADIFKDIAHCFVGGLIGAAILATALRKFINENWQLYTLPAGVLAVQDKVNKYCFVLWVLALGLTTLEVVAFLLLKSS